MIEILKYKVEKYALSQLTFHIYCSATHYIIYIIYTHYITYICIYMHIYIYIYTHMY